MKLRCDTAINVENLPDDVSRIRRRQERHPSGKFQHADRTAHRNAGGVYFVKLEAGAVTQTRKIVYLAGPR
jgi:hypothetical protein